MSAASGFPRPFGPYVLVAELGRGGMGEVYLAWSGNVADIAKLCVIKTMRPDVAERDAAHRRFLDEARISVSLNHANICSVYDVGQVGETSYIAMEYAGRRTLRDVQNRARELGVGLPEDVAVWLLSRVLEGLEHAHAARDPLTGKPLQIVHRDVSPQNVMVRHDGAVKLIDFGLARSTVKVEQTQTGMVAGKLTYMAPEQVRSEPIDARADQFAAAVMLYELIAGERYYEELREHEIWAAAAPGGYRPRRWDAISPDLQVVLDVALAGSAADRFPTCEAFLEALGGALQSARLADARRFKQVMKELFPSGEDDERSFLQALPEHSAVRGLVAAAAAGTGVSITVPNRVSGKVAAAEAAVPTSTDGKSEENTAALVSQLRPRRWPLLAAALGVLVVLLALAAVALVGNGGDVPDPKTATASSDEPAGEPGDEPADEPVRVASSGDEPKPANGGDERIEEPAHPDEPVVASAEATEATEVTAATKDAGAIATPRAEERGPEGERRKPRQGRPKHTAKEPATAEATSTDAPPPREMTEIERYRATLARCQDPCAPFFLKSLSKVNEIPRAAKGPLQTCLDRCVETPR